MSYYSKRHYQLVSPPADKPEQVAYRIKYAAVLAQVREEMTAMFSTVTEDNFQAALDYQAARIKELMG